jgi:signal transduction histidine kinase
MKKARVAKWPAYTTRFGVCASLRRKWLLVVLFALLPFTRTLTASGAGREKNILVLYSFSERSVTLPIHSLESALRANVSFGLNFYVEYLESLRFADNGYQKGLVETLRETYGGQKLDLVITESYPALQFALEHRDELFRGVPIVFYAVDRGRIAGKRMSPGVTGVTETVDVRATIDLALHLHPNTKTVAVITNGSEYERYWLTSVRGELLHHQNEVREIDLVSLPTSLLLEKIAMLPQQTVVLFQEAPQQSIRPAIGAFEVLALIGKRLPTYCIFPILCLNRGGIGGVESDGQQQIAPAAELAGRVLSGERPESIPVVNGTGAQVRVDWRQLRRWNIPESALPPGAIVLYREPTVWERHERYILAGVAVIILQALLVAGLLWQRARKRFATGALQQLGGHLIHAQDDERARIARELHDDFGQRLAVQCIELTQLGKNLPESEVEERARVSQLLKETKGMSADMRSLSHELHCSRLDLIGLVPALSGLCEEITQKYESDVRFTEHEFAVNLTKDVELCLFRVAQEALVNVVKHSQAKSAHVELAASANRLTLRISDEGKGFDTDLKKGAGIGLISMRERLRLVGGRLSVRSEPMRGTEVLAEIPLSALANEGQEINTLL